MRNLNSNTKMFTGIILGAVTGAALGILFAPSEGQKTRKKISEDLDKFSSDTLNKLNHETELLKNKINGLLASSDAESLANKAEEGIEKAEKMANDVKSEAKDNANSFAK